MKPETKLWIRRRALMALRWLVWTADEFLHAAELRLQHDLACHAVAVEQSRGVSHTPRSHDLHPDQVHTSGSVAGRRSLAARDTASPKVGLEKTADKPSSRAGQGNSPLGDGVSAASTSEEAARDGATTSGETFLQWEARRSGVAPIAKPRRSRQHFTAADFDRQFTLGKALR